jgi:CDP-paratose 2-epimerase
LKLLITGGCGFLGSNLVAHGVKRGDQVLVIDNLSRHGSSDNLAWLRLVGEFEFCNLDVRDADRLTATMDYFRPDTVFHLAGQVAMTTSIANPRLDFEVNALGTFNILDAVRRNAPDAVFLYSSTNKVYGDLLQYHYEEMQTRYVCKEYPRGFNEKVPLEFHSPLRLLERICRSVHPGLWQDVWTEDGRVSALFHVWWDDSLLHQIKVG